VNTKKVTFDHHNAEQQMIVTQIIITKKDNVLGNNLARRNIQFFFGAAPFHRF
jgi:hypothetical protein